MGPQQTQSNDCFTDLNPFDAVTNLQYLKWQELYLREKPYQVFCPLEDPTAIRSNLVFEEKHNQIVRNARGRELQFGMDEHGFIYRTMKVDPSIFANPSKIENQYLTMVKSLIHRELDDVAEVYVFDWQIRRTKMPTSGIIDGKDKTQHLLPSSHVHLDQHPTNVPSMVRRHFPNRAARLLKRRVRIINVWKPLVDVVHDFPLALCDGGTISNSDLVAADHITRCHFDINSFGLYSARHQWWFLHEQLIDEVVVFKNFDSDYTVKAKCCLHSSFEQHLLSSVGKAGRESIEVRLMVFS